MRDRKDGKNRKSRNSRTKKHFAGIRLGRLVWYDLSYGYRSTRLKWLGAALVQAYFAVMAVQGCSMPGASGEVLGMQAAGEQILGVQVPGVQAPGVLGYLGFLLQGMPEYFLSETGKFELPVPWLMLQGYLLFLTVSYPAGDLARSGGQAIVRAGRRRDWLFGKAVWVGCTVAGYYLLLTATVAVCALATGGLAPESGNAGGLRIEGEAGCPATEGLTDKSMAAGSASTESLAGESMAIESTSTESLAGENMAAGSASIKSPGRSQGFLTDRYGIDLAELGGWEIFLRWWGQPVLVSLALCLAQLVASLALGPALSLFLTLGYLTASVFWASPRLLGNFSMLLRQDFLSGIPEICFRNCLFLCAAWSIGALSLGAVWIGRKDLF
ncbi:MAG: hypothetical protein HFH97_13655 [Lachnospiraceae bacterium]|nr:hypothetical protein [uncultured Acetatifactor sp.]MCI9573625.1 hypothetical protein [Lachnospiraceae bacterium]